MYEWFYMCGMDGYKKKAWRNKCGNYIYIDDGIYHWQIDGLMDWCQRGRLNCSLAILSAVKSLLLLLLFITGLETSSNIGVSFQLALWLNICKQNQL